MADPKHPAAPETEKVAVGDRVTYFSSNSRLASSKGECVGTVLGINPDGTVNLEVSGVAGGATVVRAVSRATGDTHSPDTYRLRHGDEALDPVPHPELARTPPSGQVPTGGDPPKGAVNPGQTIDEEAVRKSEQKAREQAAADEHAHPQAPKRTGMATTENVQPVSEPYARDHGRRHEP